METFAESSSSTNISINEPGLHWNCIIDRDERQSVIHCFGEKGYAISFRIDDVSKARGRTKLENELISSVVSWLRGSNLNEMHDEFEFIDPGKRALENIRDQAIEAFPELEQCTSIKLEPKFSESFCLWITTSKRYCKIYFSGQSQFPTCEFYWEDFYVFEFALDNMLNSVLIFKRWFCDNAVPSALAEEFPFLDKDELSEYCDFGKVVEADFIRSWEYVEQFYKEFSNLYNLDIVNISKLITQMRHKGYDKTLRSGNSLSALVLSRSLHHGLRDDQPFLIIEFHKGNLEIFKSHSARFEDKPNLYSSKIELTPQAEGLLKDLETRNID